MEIDKQQNLENSKNNSSWGGSRKGAGRHKGGENQSTKDKKASKKELDKKILKSVDQLYISQMMLARGCSYLYRIDKDAKGNNKKPELVDNRQEIEEYLRGEIDADSYYFITTEKPDNKAIDSMIDRVFGRATQEIQGDISGNITIEGFNFITNETNNSTNDKTGTGVEETNGQDN